MLTLLNKTEVEKFEIRFTVYASKGTLEYELLAYLKKNKSMSRDRLKEMAMAALTGYYLPPARVNSSEVTKEQRSQAVVDGIHRLQLQQQYFRELGGLCGATSAVEFEEEESADECLALQEQLETLDAVPQEVQKKEAEFDPEEMF